jgi:hypothetical protein
MPGDANAGRCQCRWGMRGCIRAGAMADALQDALQRVRTAAEMNF